MRSLVVSVFEKLGLVGVHGCLNTGNRVSLIFETRGCRRVGRTGAVAGEKAGFGMEVRFSVLNFLVGADTLRRFSFGGEYLSVN
jgi:hypothetical protein